MKFDGVITVVTTVLLIAIESVFLLCLLIVCVIVIRDPTELIAGLYVAVGILAPPLLVCGVLLHSCTDEQWVEHRYWLRLFMKVLSFAGIAIGCVVFSVIAVDAVSGQLRQLLEQ